MNSNSLPDPVSRSAHLSPSVFSVLQETGYYRHFACCKNVLHLRVFTNRVLRTSCNSTKKKNSPKDTRFLFCFVFGRYPMASKNTQALSLLALPEVQTNLMGSWLIVGSLRRGDAGLASARSDAGLSQEGVRDHKVIVMLIRRPSSASFSWDRRCW